MDEEELRRLVREWLALDPADRRRRLKLVPFVKAWHERHPRRLRLHERECEECGQVFMASRSDALRCSVRCRVRAHRAQPAGLP